ncbi:zinc finger protein 277 isoform X1 [Trichogramma pretiosum]|uniref:zinc finger protein 277 isoform X1 n=1 Tax=Trichogramma pretiosum TaxID=7493 RepID=UPI0006C99221|nr:zinc finger protein 277 isoform X1 [Trichogramma pretiosum]
MIIIQFFIPVDFGEKNFLKLAKMQNHSTPCKSQFIDLDDNPAEMACLLCDSMFLLPTNKQEFLEHLMKDHSLIIGDVDKIASLKSYIRYWKVRFRGQLLTTFCTTLKEDKPKDSSSGDNQLKTDYYFMLSDCLAEDKALRDELSRAKLEYVCAVQVKERSDTSFKRGCMFCRTDFAGSRIEYLKHLTSKHNIIFGKLENLVFIDEYLDKLEECIENLTCIYCEGKFKDRLVLKEHMRKKLHKKVNPNNKVYDKFYLTSYYRTDNRQTHNKVDVEVNEDLHEESEEEKSDEWETWKTEYIKVRHCLFCNHTTDDFHAILDHMKLVHNFDLKDATQGRDYYDKVKIVNYIRRQMRESKCMYCEEVQTDCLSHMKEQNHFKLPIEKIWVFPEYFFPIIENDEILGDLDTDSDEKIETELKNNISNIEI